MPIIFRSTPIREPFSFDSLGNHWDQDRVSRPKGFPYYHYLQTESGTGRVEAAGRTYHLHAHQGILLAPFLRHSYERETEQWFTLFATFTGTIESSISRITGGRQVILIDAEQGQKIAPLIDGCVRQYEQRPLDEKKLSLDCYRILQYFVDGSQARPLSEDPLYRNYIQPTIAEIERHFDQELTVEQLSRQVFITPQYLSRLFRRFLNCSTYEYLVSYRISKAKEFLMSNPRMEIQHIAQKTGFSDASHFIATFRKLTGMTPLEFRRQN